MIGSAPVEEAVRRCEEILAEIGDARASRAITLGALAASEAMAGRIARARELLSERRAIYEDLGMKLMMAMTVQAEALVELLDERPAAAEEWLRMGYETLVAFGEVHDAALCAGSLAEAVYRQGRYDDAAEYAAVSEARADAGNLEAQVDWRVVKAKILARRGRFAEAEALSREALSLESPESLFRRATTTLGLAEVLALGGREQQAIETSREALRLFEAKGDVRSAARARSFLDSLGAATGVSPGGDRFR